MSMSQVPYTITVSVLPPFKPNQYLLETFKSKGKSDWEIFAWAVRDAMCDAGGFKSIDASAKDKILYKNFMTGKTNEILAPNGKVYKAEPMKK